jgi:hypothetical protein
LVEFDRKHFEVSKLVKILSVSITELICQAKTIEKPQSIPMQVYGSIYKIPPRMQFLWLPLDVNSLYTWFQACFLKNERVTIVFPKGAQQEK